MKLYLSVAVLVALIAAVYCDNDYCAGPSDTRSCDYDECCVKSYWGNGYTCKDKGDDIGDACGGEYNCACKFGFTCQPYPSSFLTKFKRGAGTCQLGKYPNTGY
ncbi:hypothetical protein CHUAL_007552 [Chamberlinius hualienensis]